MVSSEQKVIFLKTLGKHGYAPKILLYLNSKGIVNPSSKQSYSIEHIRGVMNGHRENVDIELAIYDFYEETKTKAERLKKLQSKNTQQQV